MAEAAGAPAPTPQKPLEARPKRKRPKTEEPIAAQTQLMHVAKSTATLPALPSDLLPPETTEEQLSAENAAVSEAVELAHVEEIALKALIDKTAETPPPVREPLPDRAVEPPETVKTADDISLQPADSASEESGSRPLGPMEVRTIRDQQDAEKSERAKLWAEMRYRERQTQLAREQQETAASRKRYSEGGGSGKLVRRAIVVLLGVALLSAAGYGMYSLIFANRDIKISAIDLWNEFAKNNEQANQKYKELFKSGKFLRVTGKLKARKMEKTTQLVFAPPDEDAKWFIKINLRPSDMKDLQPDQEVTIRFRFNPRKTEDSDLDMSNSTLIKEK
jgi:tRNA_anti-like